MKDSLALARRWLDLTLGRVQPSSDSQRRNARVLQAALTGLAGRGVAVIVSIISVPLTVGYLGSERYGVWVTLSTLLAWLAIADLGLGNGLLNAVSEAYGQDRPDLAQRYVATAFWMLVGVGAGAGLLIALAWPGLNWAALFNVQSALARAEVDAAVALALLLTLLNLPLTISLRVLLAYQEGAVANYWAAAGNAASLFGIVVVSFSEGGLPGLVLGFTGTQVVVAALSLWWLVRRYKPWLWPSLSAFDHRSWRRLFRTGVEFFLLQIAALILFQTDNLVIAYFRGPEQVTAYSVVYRLFNYVIVVQAFFLNPLWPAYAEAVARDDWGWVRRTFRRTLWLGLGAAFITIVALVLVAEPVIRIWTRGAVAASPPLIWLIALWTGLAFWGNLFAFLENGLGHIRIQTALGLLMAAVNLALSIWWVQLFGVLGVIGATLVAYGGIIAWAVPLDAFRVLRRHA